MANAVHPTKGTSRTLGRGETDAKVGGALVVSLDVKLLSFLLLLLLRLELVAVEVAVSFDVVFSFSAVSSFAFKTLIAWVAARKSTRKAAENSEARVKAAYAEVEEGGVEAT